MCIIWGVCTAPLRSSHTIRFAIYFDNLQWHKYCDWKEIKTPIHSERLRDGASKSMEKLSTNVWRKRQIHVAKHYFQRIVLVQCGVRPLCTMLHCIIVTSVPSVTFTMCYNIELIGVRPASSTCRSIRWKFQVKVFAVLCWAVAVLTAPVIKWCVVEFYCSNGWFDVHSIGRKMTLWLPTLKAVYRCKWHKEHSLRERAHTHTSNAG